MTKICRICDHSFSDGHLSSDVCGRCTIHRPASQAAQDSREQLERRALMEELEIKIASALGWVLVEPPVSSPDPTAWRAPNGDYPVWTEDLPKFCTDWNTRPGLWEALTEDERERFIRCVVRRAKGRPDELQRMLLLDQVMFCEIWHAVKTSQESKLNSP